MVPRSANAAEAALLAKKKAAKNQPKPPFNPSDPSTWPQATPGRVAQMQADQGYKPLTGKATGQYVAPDTNMYNATPTDVARGTVGFLNTNLRDPLYRTFSTQNLQKALNPNTNETDRALAIAEDTLNIASVVPGVRAIGGYIDDAVRFADDGVNALARAISNRRNRNQLDLPSILGRQPTNRLQQAASTQSIKEGELAKKIGDIKHTQGKTTPWHEEWFADLPEDTERFFHTTPTGGRLPSQLKTVREAARIPERRGSGATQLFSGGPYGSNAGDISVTYYEGDIGAVKDEFPYSVIPDRMIDDLAFTPAGVWKTSNLGFDVSPSQIQQLKKMQVDDIKRQMFNIDDPMPQIGYMPEFEGKTIREVLDSAKTPEQALSIIDRFPRPIVYKPKPTTSTNPWDVAAANERITFQHPIVKNPDGSYSRTAIVSPDSGLYLSGNNASSIQPFTPEYWSQIRELADGRYAKKMQELKNQFPGLSETEYRTLISTEQPDNNFALDVNNIWNFVNNNRSQSVFQRMYNTLPGQNYWDLPVVRNDADEIVSMGGLKAIDLDNGSPETFDQLFENIRNFVNERYPEFRQDQYVQGLIERIKFLPQAQQKTVAFRDIQDSLDAALKLSPNAGQTVYGDEMTPKEEMYEYLQEIGFGIIPHTGGQNTGGRGHLAINVLKPELLPPSQYVEPLGANFDSLLNDIARQKAIQLREVRSQGTGRELTGYLAQERMNKRLMDAARAARLAPIAGTPRQATSNR